MHPVEAEALGQFHMLADHQRHIAGMGDLAQGVGGARQAVLVAGRKAQADAGDGMAVQHPGQEVREGSQFYFGRGDEVELRRVARVHGVGPSMLARSSSASAGE